MSRAFVADIIKYRKGGDDMTNAEIKKVIRDRRLFNYEVAAQLGISEFTFSRWFRKELDEDKRKRVLNAINELSGKES